MNVARCIAMYSDVFRFVLEMNDIFARRAAKSDIFFAAMRAHPVLRQATDLTHERLDFHFIREEFMRVNGFRQMPLLMHEAAQATGKFSHWNALLSSTTWVESKRAFTVRNQSPLTQRYCAMGRLAASMPATRTAASAQNLFLEHMDRVEGISSFEGSESI